MPDSSNLRPLAAEDLYRLSWILGLDLSPGGGRVVYVVKSVDQRKPEPDGYVYGLYVVNTQSGDSTARNLLPGVDARMRSPRWVRGEEQVAFISDLSGQDNVWSLDLTTGDLVMLTDHSRGIREFSISPDSQWLALVGSIEEENGDNGEFVPGRFRVLKRLLYKSDGAGYWSGTRAHVFLMPVSGRADNSMVQLTSGPFDHGSLAWSPCSSRLAVVSTRSDDPDRDPLRHLFCLDIELDASGSVSSSLRQVTKGVAAGMPSWSPDGQYIAFIGHDNGDDRATNTGLWVASVADGRLINLTADIDRPVGDYVTDDMNAEGSSFVPAWSQTGDRLYTLMTDRGCSRVIRLDFPGEAAFKQGAAVSNLLDEPPADPFAHTTFNVEPLRYRNSRAFAFAYDGRSCLVTAESLPDRPGDLLLYPLDREDAEPRKLTGLNDELFDELAVADPIPVSSIGSEGRTIEGWLLLPPCAPAPYPLVLHIHGGPHSAHSPAFNFELQHLAASGYAVLSLNPHGSHSYGRAINTGTRLDWGGKDYSDLMMGVDSIILRDDIDKSRLGVAGGSYGGWMVNYIVTRTTRFKGAVAQRSSANRISTFLSSMVGFRHARWEAPGYPWEHPEYFLKVSPVMHAGNVETPLLLIHAENDHLCPLTQAEEMYTALKVQGKEVELVVFLGESHHLPRVGRPNNRVERLRRTRDWFDNHV